MSHLSGSLSATVRSSGFPSHQRFSATSAVSLARHIPELPNLGCSGNSSPYRRRERAISFVDSLALIESTYRSHKSQPSQSGGLAILRRFGIQRAYPDHQTGL